MVNEKHETAKCYAKFDVDALCTLPSVSSPISKIDKMEGGKVFNNAMLIIAENEMGETLLQRYHLLMLYPQSIASTAAEAAILEYGGFYRFLCKVVTADPAVLIARSHTSVPVLKVLTWSSDTLNPVGPSIL